MNQNDRDARVQSIKARFPYQFEGARLEVDVAAGWADVFEKLCEEVDQLLGVDKRGFHWDQVKEKFGSARFYYQMGVEPADLRLDLQSPSGAASVIVPAEKREGSHYSEELIAIVKQLRRLTIAAEKATQHMCAVCGQPGELDRSQPWVLVVCDEHKAQRESCKELDDFWLRFNRNN